MNSIEMTNKSIVDDLLDKFVVEIPKSWNLPSRR